MSNLLEKLNRFKEKGSPGYREPFFESYSRTRPEKPLPYARKSAVSLITYKKDNEFTFPLILRQTYKGVHSGQISLPGGKQEVHDTDLIDTAIRESSEEIGININRKMHSQPLLPLYIPPSQMHVHPFFFIYDSTPSLVKDDREVERIIEVNLEEFLSLEPVNSLVKIEKTRLKVPSYVIENEIVWGATALILSEFRQALKTLS